jgi:WD40 repeat protein
LWHVANLSCAKVFTGHGHWVQSVRFSPSGKILASGSFDGSVRLWNVDGEGGSCLPNLSGHMSSVSFSPDGRTLASGSRDGTFRFCVAYK